MQVDYERVPHKRSSSWIDATFARILYDKNEPQSEFFTTPRSFAQDLIAEEDDIAHVLHDGEDQFWNKPTRGSISASTVEPRITKFRTDISISLKGPDPKLQPNSNEFKKQAKEIKRDIQRLSRCSSYQAQRKSSKGQPLVDVDPCALKKLEKARQHRFCESAEEGRKYLCSFFKTHYPDRVEQVRLLGDFTIDEIKMIGNEPRSIGVQSCRKLFHIPVIGDEVGYRLWRDLRQGEHVDYSHDSEAEEASNNSPENEGYCFGWTSQATPQET